MWTSLVCACLLFAWVQAECPSTYEPITPSQVVPTLVQSGKLGYCLSVPYSGVIHLYGNLAPAVYVRRGFAEEREVQCEGCGGYTISASGCQCHHHFENGAKQSFTVGRVTPGDWVVEFWWNHTKPFNGTFMLFTHLDSFVPTKGDFPSNKIAPGRHLNTDNLPSLRYLSFLGERKDELVLAQTSPLQTGTITVYIRAGAIPDPRTPTYQAMCNTSEQQTACVFPLDKLPHTKEPKYVLIVGMGLGTSEYRIGIAPASNDTFKLTLLEFVLLVGLLFLFVLLAGIFFFCYVKLRLNNPEQEYLIQ